MTERSLLQIQVLEKLGAPLIAAAGGGMATEGPQTAERLAALMGRAIQSALALAKTMEIKDSDPQADSVKLALASISAALLAGHYRATGKVPDDNEVKRLSGALETILSYGDNFLVAAGRLQAMDPGPYPADEHQVGIQVINALVPVVNAVSAFPFGQPERKLVQEVAEKLVIRARVLRQTLVPAGADEGKNKVLELALLRGLSALYVACHEEGKMKIMAMDEASRVAAVQQNGGALPMDSVWQNFESRVGALEILGRNIMPGAAAGAAGNGAARAPAARPAETQGPAVAPPPAASPPAPADAPPAADGAPHNPMAFFKPGVKKQGETGEGQKG